MNYIKLINHYWDTHDKYSLKSNDCALFLYLVHRCNSSDWADEVEVRNSVAMEVLDISFRPYQSSRDRLKESGLIDFISSNGSKFTRYSLYDPDRKTFAATFAKNTKVTAKVSAKVAAEVKAKVREPDLMYIKTQTKTETEPAVDNRKVFIHANNKTHFDKYFAEENQEGRNAVMKMYRLTAEQLEAYADGFMTQLNTEQKKHPTFEEWRKHFLNWLRIKIEKERRNDESRSGTKNNMDGVDAAADAVLASIARKHGGGGNQ